MPPPIPVPILMFLVTARYAAAQQSTPSFEDDSKDPYGKGFNATTAILIVVIVSCFFFLAFFSVYFRRCSRDRSAVSPAFPGAVTAIRQGGDRRGLDPAVIETFPTLTYSAVTGIKIGGEALECAVCLSEFAHDETLRMLPKCCHVFHPECIDTWLQSHVTCPVCRSDLSVAPTEDQKIPGPDQVREEETVVDDVAIDLGRMGRSHSTGHVRVGGVDRFTLRLPEHVRREIVQAGSLRRSASVAVFRGGGEGSSRRGYRGFWVGRSDRWTAGILARVSTWRRGEAEGSVRGGTMFNCLSGGGGGIDRGGSGSSISVKNSTEVMDRV